MRRAEHGETVAVIAHGEHVADVVPSGELARLRETIEVLADTDAVRALADAEPVVHGRDAIRALVAERVTRDAGDRSAAVCAFLLNQPKLPRNSGAPGAVGSDRGSLDRTQWPGDGYFVVSPNPYG